jgi:uncharacterized membrane protein
MRHSEHTKRVSERRRHLGFKSRQKRPSAADRIADALTIYFGTLWCLAGNVALFVVWIVVNLGLVPGIPVFDPYPFNLLTMAVSLEAIALSVIVLVSQNFQSRIAEMRAELDFEINVRAEQEVTKLIGMVRQIQEHLGIECTDPEVQDMERQSDIEAIQSEIESQNAERAAAAERQ